MVEQMISAVLSRPRMYTLHGTYPEVVVFLEGYYSGVALNGPKLPSVQIWGDFRRFLSNHEGVASSQALHALERRSGDDSLNELERLFNEFRASDT